MGGFFFWLVLVACVIALVILFFPFRFRIEFEAGEHGAKARFFFFSKKLWTGEKKWGKKTDTVEKDGTDYLDGDDSDKDVDDAAPEFVATAPAPAKEPKPAPEVKEEKPAPESKPAEKNVVPEPAPATKPAEPAAESKPAEKPAPSATPKDEPKAVPSPAPVQDTPEPAPEKKEKRQLTDEEFWTIILTPDLDGRAFRYVKSLLSMIVRLFNVKFENCFVEGIRSDYASMGYGAAANAVLKGFPYLESWDIRMDWCRDKELRTEGKILARTNLCRVFFLLLATLVYAGILFLIFWRRRARVLKTGELPELGYVRKKIVGWMVEE